jgi:hypothetical protein
MNKVIVYAKVQRKTVFVSDYRNDIKLISSRIWSITQLSFKLRSDVGLIYENDILIGRTLTESSATICCNNSSLSRDFVGWERRLTTDNQDLE